MRVLRAQSSWLLLALIHQVCSLSLLEALASYPELSTLYGKINTIPSLVSLLGNADGFTFFAPTNTAIESFLQSQLNTTQNATFQALVQYSLVKGGFPSVTFSNEPQFVPTNLNDSRYANVTGGQVVELVENNGSLRVVSGNHNISSLTTMDIVCGGGIIHIVDQVFNLPEPTVDAITQARLAYFVSILTRGGYLSSTKNQYVHELIDSTDVTYFIPNSEAALSNFTGMATTWSDDDLKRNLQYHVVPKRVVYSSNLQNGTTLVTAEGGNITITTLGEDTYVNGAKITSTDFLASNGVIHVIDTLLDRFNTAPPSNATQVSNKTLPDPTSTSTPNPTLDPAQTSTSPSTSPTSTSTLVPASASNASSNLPLKIGLGAGLGGFALLTAISICIVLLLLRRRRQRRTQRISAPIRGPSPLSGQSPGSGSGLGPLERDSGNWDGHSMSTAPSESKPKRYFVSNGSVQQQQQQQQQHQMREKDAGVDTGVDPLGMVPVTILERGYGYPEKEPIVPPPRSPGRAQGVSYF